MNHYYAVSIAGPDHNDRGIPCQDSFYVTRNEEGTLFAACADGLGSEQYSDIGSRIAAQISVEYCAQHFRNGEPFAEVKKTLNNAFVFAYRTILEEAQRAGNSSDEYDTTLCLAIFDDEHLYYGQSGDSGIVVLFKEGYYISITEQQRDEDGYVFPLCAGPEMWVFGEIKEAVSSVMLMTDGVFEQICPRVLKNNDVKINVSLAKQFMDRTESTDEEINLLQKAAYSYLEEYPRRLLDDDKTLIVLFNPEEPATRLASEYYSAPNWEELYDRAKEKLYGKKSDLTNIEDKQLSEVPISTSTREDMTNSFIPEKSSNQMNGASTAEDESTKLSNEGFGNDEYIINDQAHCKAKVSPQHIKKLSKITLRREQYLIDNTKTSFGHITTNIIIVIILLSFSMIAYLSSGFVKEHAPASCFGVFLVCFISNATVLLPAPSILVVLQYSLIINPVAVAVSGAVGASLGEMIGFLTGTQGGRIVNNKLIQKLKKKFPKHPYVYVFSFAALPLPFFDVIGVIAGAIKLSIMKFYLTCLAGKLFKMLIFVWAGQIILQIVA